MSNHRNHILFTAAGTVALVLSAGSQGAQRQISYNREIRPILSQNCFRCHGPDSAARKAGLRLDTEEGSRRALIPGNPSASRAYQRITDSNPARRMPPADSHLKLTPAQTELIRVWIRQGAKYETHWAFLPPERPRIPSIQNPKSKIQNPIDSFILARLQKEGLTFSAEAPKERLLRRVTMDLTGLPPTLQELNSYLSDPSDRSYEKVVDRLLASPRFGERWAWEWLEAARYSDTNGYQEDRTRTMWPWRDWVIRALNDDMPFDQFTREQIAGDLLPDATLSQKIATGFNRNHMLNGEGGRIPEESRVEYVVDRVDTTSTVWLGLTMACARCHDHKYDPLTQREYYQLYAYFNNVSETGGVDRSHSANPVIPLPSDEQSKQIALLQAKLSDARKELTQAEARLRERQPAWEEKVKTEGSKLPDAAAAALKVESDKRSEQQRKDLAAYYFSTDSRREELRKQTESLQKSISDINGAVPLAMVMDEKKDPRDTFILLRGAYDKYGEKVTPGTPALLNPLPDLRPNNRFALANWLVDPKNPLTARVTVNRVWQQLFGTGLVRTSEDFGIQGEPPSHPELLDWLAVEFMHGVMENGSNGVVDLSTPSLHHSIAPKPWSLKRLIKLIVTSQTYRQDSKTTPKLLEKDPQNRLLSRAPRFRWPSHVIRDQALAASGLLVEKVGGPSVKPYQPEGVWEDFSYGKITYIQDHGENLYRRSLYTFWRRSVAPPAMFDTAARRVCVVRNERTNTPLQALNLLNDVQYIEAARVLAQRVCGMSIYQEERLKTMFTLVTARFPSASEMTVLERGFHRNLERFKKDPTAAEKLLSVGEAKRDPVPESAELAAYTIAATTILNMDEALTRE